jgi:hypothetical protein
VAYAAEPVRGAAEVLQPERALVLAPSPRREATEQPDAGVMLEGLDEVGAAARLEDPGHLRECAVEVQVVQAPVAEHVVERRILEPGGVCVRHRERQARGGRALRRVARGQLDELGGDVDAVDRRPELGDVDREVPSPARVLQDARPGEVTDLAPYRRPQELPVVEQTAHASDQAAVFEPPGRQRIVEPPLPIDSVGIHRR